MPIDVSRRTFLAGSLGAALFGHRLLAANQGSTNKVCAFIKFVQSLSYEALAEQMAMMGFDGVEATVREGGLIEPAAAPDELPKLVEALAKHGLEITVMTTGVTRADDPVSQRLLRAAALLDIKRYRLGYYRYDLKRSVTEQIAELRPQVQELASLNHDLGITAVYQNHAGQTNVGSTIWDLHLLLQGIPAQDLGIAFDIRHATAEAGVSWPVLFNVAAPHLQAVFVKDFAWKGREPANVPLGQGQVDPAFFRLLKQADFTGPISLHVEYLPEAGVEQNLAALKTDLVTLKQWLAQA